MDDKDLGAVSALLSDFSTRINDLEERIRLIKDRLLTVSQTLLKQSDWVNKEMRLMKEDISSVKNEIDRLKDITQHMISESSEFVHREELKVLERSMRLFDPLKFTTEEDVKRIVNKAIKEKKEGIIKIKE